MFFKSFCEFSFELNTLFKFFSYFEWYLDKGVVDEENNVVKKAWILVMLVGFTGLFATNF